MPKHESLTFTKRTSAVTLKSPSYWNFFHHLLHNETVCFRIQFCYHPQVETYLMVPSVTQHCCQCNWPRYVSKTRSCLWRVTRNKVQDSSFYGANQDWFAPENRSTVRSHKTLNYTAGTGKTPKYELYLKIHAIIKTVQNFGRSISSIILYFV